MQRPEATDVLTMVPPEDSAAALYGLEPIDWSTFWNRPLSVAEWAIEPLVPKGRQVAIYSPAKGSKSLLTLDGIAAAVTGRSIYGQDPNPPIRVLYVDLEMTQDDLRERLEDLGYGPNDDLSGLAYYQLPSMPALDGPLGGEALLEIVSDHRAELVVVDTMARAVSGKENDADTYRAFYRFTGQRLKANGVGLLRLDHMGKDAALGQRGSSSKADDVDVVFRLSTVGNRLTLTRTHSRVPWVAGEVNFDRQEEPLRHVLAAENSWPAGTAEFARLLDGLNVPLDSTVVSALAVLKAAGHGRRKMLVLQALRFRRTRP